MKTAAIDFVPWGLEAAWPSRRWQELVDGRRDGPRRGVRAVRLGHANDSAMVLVCTYPRARFDAEMPGTGADLVRELAFETTFALINLVLHQVKVPGRRPDGLVGSLVSYASLQADRYQDWGTTLWGMGHEYAGRRTDGAVARTTALGGWRSGFSLADRDAYIVVHACGASLDQLLLTPVTDPSSYGLAAEPPLLGDMHWELWPNHQEIGYDDLALLVGAR
jgi:hypothetical protein